MEWHQSQSYVYGSHQYFRLSIFTLLFLGVLYHVSSWVVLLVTMGLPVILPLTCSTCSCQCPLSACLWVCMECTDALKASRLLCCFVGSPVRKGFWVTTMVVQPLRTSWPSENPRVAEPQCSGQTARRLPFSALLVLSSSLIACTLRGLPCIPRVETKEEEWAHHAIVGLPPSVFGNLALESSFLCGGTVIRMNFIALGSPVPHTDLWWVTNQS